MSQFPLKSWYHKWFKFFIVPATDKKKKRKIPWG